MKKISVLVMIMVLVMRVYGNIPSNIVEDTLKESRDSEFDELMIEAAKKNPKFYTLKEEVRVKIEEDDFGLVANGEEGVLDISNVAQDSKKMLALGVGGKGIFDTLVAIDQIVNIGSKVWKMVVENKPVLEVKTKYAVALPMGVKSARELSGWSRPKSYFMSFYFENLFGIDVIRVSYRVIYIYGGSYQWRGKYIAAVYAIPERVDVLWGFSFKMQAYVPDATVVNVGTSANPIAALQLNVSWSASSFLKKVDGTDVFYIQGDGYFEKK
jgi:hypothetical protein